MEPLVGIIIGSDSDLGVMSKTAEILDKLEIPYEFSIISAHRTPDRMYEYARQARKRGLKAIIAAMEEHRTIKGSRHGCRYDNRSCNWRSDSGKST